MISVHYVGRLMNGSKFDSSRDRGDPLTFKLGNGEISIGFLPIRVVFFQLVDVASEIFIGSVVLLLWMRYCSVFMGAFSVIRRGSQWVGSWVSDNEEG